MQQRAGLSRLFAVSFATDLEAYLIYTAVPFKALHLGADPLYLGALAAASTGTYAVLAPLFGRLSDRVPRTNLARTSCAGLILACLGLTLAPSLRWMLLCIPLVGASLALFWPSVQASIGDRSTLTELKSHLGRFNLCWSLGKGSGFLLGGVLVAAFGATGAFTVASLISCVIFFLIPGPPGTSAGPIDALLARLRKGAPGESPGAGALARARTSARDAGAAADAPAASAPVVPPESPEIDARAPLFRRLAWSANCAAYGVAATLNHHYPRLVQERGWSPRTFGLILGLVYFTQTVAFAVLMLRPEAWRFRRLRLYLPQLVVIAAVLSLPFANMGRVLASALVFGAGLGICYYSSIYYSLHTHAGRGRNAGVHEALIGLGSMAVPLVGGILARQLGVLWVPYVVAAVAVGLSLVVQETLYRAGTAAAGRQAALAAAGTSGLAAARGPRDG